MIKLSKSREETENFARYIAEKGIKKGDIICLFGDLGAGKSVMAAAMVRFFVGENQNVPSPTFTIVNNYKTDSLVVNHLDLYRIQDKSELSSIGIDEILFGENSISIVEWPERLEGYLDMFDSKIKPVFIRKTSDTSREIKVDFLDE